MTGNKPRPMRDSDLRALREMFGGNTTELSYLIGTSLINHKMSQTVGGDRAIPDPRTSLLVRFLLNNPDEKYVPMPVMPEYDEFAKLMTMNWLPDQLSTWHRPLASTAGIHGPLLGVNSSAGYNWAKGGNHDTVISRLFWVISNLLRSEGKAGMQKWLDTVDEEARSRGKDLQTVMKDRTWGRKDRAARKTTIKP